MGVVMNEFLSFLLGVLVGVVVFWRVAYRLGQKAAEWVIGNKMW